MLKKIYFFKIFFYKKMFLSSRINTYLSHYNKFYKTINFGEESKFYITEINVFFIEHYTGVQNNKCLNRYFYKNNREIFNILIYFLKKKQKKHIIKFKKSFIYNYKKYKNRIDVKNKTKKMTFKNIYFKKILKNYNITMHLTKVSKYGKFLHLGKYLKPRSKPLEYQNNLNAWRYIKD